MSPSPPTYRPAGARERRDELMRERQYRAYAAAIDRFLSATYGGTFAREDREELRQEAFAGLETARAKGTAIRNEEALLIRSAANAAKSRLRSADRRRRQSFDPLDSPEARLPDDSVPPDVAVIEADADRRVSMLIDALDDPRARAVLKLRIELQLEWPEIASYLGLRKSQTYRLLREAGRALWEMLVDDEAGERSGEQRTLLIACEMGVATDEQRREAARLLEDPHVRALLAELRGLGRQAAGLLPLPPVAAEPSVGRFSEIAADAKAQLLDVGQTAKQHAVGLIGRTPSPEAATQFAAAGGGRGGGTVAIAMVACLGVGGGAAVGVKECIDHGVPATLVGVLPGIDGADDGGQPAAEHRPTVTAPATVPEPPPVAAAPEPAPAPSGGGGSSGSGAATTFGGL